MITKNKCLEILYSHINLYMLCIKNKPNNNVNNERKKEKLHLLLLLLLLREN